MVRTSRERRDSSASSCASMVHLNGSDHPTFEALPTHRQVLEQKISDLDIEIGKLASENQRLYATHGVLRQDLANVKHELQLIDAHNAEFIAEKEKQMRAEIDKIEKMESELAHAEPMKIQLQKARAEAQNLVTMREELILRVQRLSRELDIALLDAQQIPPLVAELDTLRQEYQHCRSTYDHDMKLYSDHLESLRVMEKNYTEMLKEAGELKERLENATKSENRAVLGDPLQFNANLNVWNSAPGQNAYIPAGQVGPGPVSFLGGPNVAALPGAELNLPHSAFHSHVMYGRGASAAPGQPGYGGPKNPAGAMK